MKFIQKFDFALVGLIVLTILGFYSTESHALTLTAPSEFSESTSDEWYRLELQMKQTKDQTITLYWKGIGGIIEEAEDFIDVVKQVQSEGKKVYLIIDGYAISCHALVVCYVSGYQMMNGSTAIVFHNATDYEENYDDYETRLTTKDCVQKGIVTQEEINKIIIQRERLEIYSDGERKFLPDYPELRND